MFPRLAAACAGLLLALTTGDPAVPEAVSAASDEERQVARCQVEIRNLPASLRDHGDYQLVFSDRPPHPLPSEGVLEIELDRQVRVELVGPAYQGSVELTPAACAAEPSHVLEARPRPARLLFQTGVPLSELIVACVEGCDHGWRVASDFPEVAMDDRTERIVTLEFKAEGRRSRVDSFRLTPGDNLIRIELDLLE